METIKGIVKHPLAKSVCCVAIGVTLLLHKMPLYSGICFGIAVREFLLAFK